MNNFPEKPNKHFYMDKNQALQKVFNQLMDYKFTTEYQASHEMVYEAKIPQEELLKIVQRQLITNLSEYILKTKSKPIKTNKGFHGIKFSKELIVLDMEEFKLFAQSIIHIMQNGQL